MTPAHLYRVRAASALSILSSFFVVTAAIAAEVAYPNAPAIPAPASAPLGIQSAPTSGGAGWTPITVPSNVLYRRVEPRAIYDSVNHRTIVFGGLYSYTEFNDLWALPDGVHSNWEPMFPAGDIPHVRWGQSAIFDPVRNRMLMIGGISGQAPP